MPQKGVLNSPRRLGCVENQGNGYRLQINVAEHGGHVRGPTRATRAEAEEDLAKARQCTTRKDMVDFVGALSQANGPVAAPSPQAVTLRGLNIQYPFSRLILLGAKSIEARRYALGHRNIACVGGRIIFD